MKDILKLNGVAFTDVTLSSFYIASLAVTFQVDLVQKNQSGSINRLNTFMKSPQFSNFSNYSVIGNTRGSVDITQAGEVICGCIKPVP